MNTTSRREQLQVAGKPCSINQTLSSFNLPKLRSSKNLERSSSLQVCTKRLGRGAAGTNQRKTVSWGNTDVQQHNGSEVADCFLSWLPVCALPRTRARKLLAANITFYYCFDQPPSSPATNPIKTQPGTQPTNPPSAAPCSCNPGQTTTEGSGSPWREVQGPSCAGHCSPVSPTQTWPKKRLSNFCCTFHSLKCSIPFWMLNGARQHSHGHCTWQQPTAPPQSSETLSRTQTNVSLYSTPCIHKRKLNTNPGLMKMSSGSLGGRLFVHPFVWF